jgi:hypothetical protein
MNTNNNNTKINSWNTPRPKGDKPEEKHPADMTSQERNEVFQQGPGNWGQEQGFQQQGGSRPMAADWKQPEVNRPQNSGMGVEPAEPAQGGEVNEKVSGRQDSTLQGNATTEGPTPQKD